MRGAACDDLGLFLLRLFFDFFRLGGNFCNQVIRVAPGQQIVELIPIILDHADPFNKYIVDNPFAVFDQHTKGNGMRGVLAEEIHSDF